MNTSHLPALVAGTLIGTHVSYAGETWTFLGFDAGDAKLERNGRKVWVSPGLCNIPEPEETPEDASETIDALPDGP